MNKDVKSILLTVLLLFLSIIAVNILFRLTSLMLGGGYDLSDGVTAVAVLPGIILGIMLSISWGYNDDDDNDYGGCYRHSTGV